MPSWTYNYVTPLNQAARDFTREHVVNEEGEFCFNKLVPMPPILSKTQKSSDFVLSAEELQKFKADNQERINTEFEDEGLLYIESDFSDDVEESHCTQECSDKLLELYGVNNSNDWALAHWGCKWDAANSEYDEDEESYSFETPWDAPLTFIYQLARACPEGQWRWRCEYEGSGEGLLIEIQDGAALLVEHFITKQEDEDYEDFEFIWDGEFYWGADLDEAQEQAREALQELEPDEVYTITLNQPIEEDDD